MEVLALTLVLLLGMALLVWLLSLPFKDVSIVDSLWSLFLLAAGLCYTFMDHDPSARALGVLGLLILWVLRLFIYLTLRNHGRPEDPRYQAIRQRNEPGFALKSLWLVFGLQAALAFVISLPLWVSLRSPAEAGPLDGLAVLLVLGGLIMESLADWQLSRFRARPENQGRVLDRGLWKYSRHPNYFGECCIWWGFWLFALPAGAWWTVFSPLLMTVLLLKVSGVALLEKDIQQRRPAYRNYLRQTRAFLPGPRRATAGDVPETAKGGLQK